MTANFLLRLKAQVIRLIELLRRKRRSIAQAPLGFSASMAPVGAKTSPCPSRRIVQPGLIKALLLVLLLAPAAMADDKPQIEQFSLSNGMKVVVVPNHTVPAVTHMVWYTVGAADDPYGKSGLAHFLEHMMFKGTESVPMGEFSKRIEKAGGISNAFTSEDYTAYFQIVAKDYLPMVMEMESDRMSHLKLDPAEILKEKQVILEEREMRVENSIGGFTNEQINAAMFHQHPYRIPTIGWVDEIRKLSVADVQDFYNRIYHPANAFLLVAGDVTVDEVKKLAEKYYGVIPAGEKFIRNWPDEPEHKASTSIGLTHPLAKQPFWEQGFLAPSYGTKDGRQYVEALTLLDYILGADKTGILYRDLVEGKKLASGVSTGYSGGVIGPAVFSVSVTPVEGASLDEIAKIASADIEKLTTSEISEADLTLAKDAMTAWRTYQLEGLRSMAFALGSMLAEGRSVDDYLEFEKKIRAVTAADIKAAATYVFTPQNSVTAIMYPADK